MKRVTVAASGRYEVLIGSGLIAEAGQWLQQAGIRGKLVVVSDDVVAPLYAGAVLDALGKAGYTAALHVFQHGERNKTLSTYQGVLDALARAGLSRSDAVVALGGGVVGDVAGFAAATYMRGIACVQMPTTLLAGIDSSVGGKTGVDLPQGKNLVGAFHQPRLVLFDTDTMKTLPRDRFWKDGMGEGLKYAVLGGGEIYRILNDGLSAENFEAFVEACVTLKRDIVQADERESGLRRLLNLGHTLGHALEKVSNFTIPHGAAVADGLLRVCDCARRQGDLPAAEHAKIEALCARYGMQRYDAYPTSALLEPIRMDKKGDGTAIWVVLPRAIGKCETRSVPYSELEAFFCGC